MPQALRIPTMLIVLFDAIRRIFLFHGHSTSLDDIGTPLHRVTGSRWCFDLTSFM
uniref:Secreted protein n=1 Tax=Heterorhabditis bacteriophora TaxID=37862 RepID=A0A1I7X1H0_HETBA